MKAFAAIFVVFPIADVLALASLTTARDVVTHTNLLTDAMPTPFDGDNMILCCSIPNVAGSSSCTTTDGEGHSTNCCVYLPTESSCSIGDPNAGGSVS